MALTVTTPDGETIEIDPSATPLTIGRHPDCDVVVPDPSVSRQHLVIDRDGGGWYVEDRSQHGTFDADGGRLDRAEVAPELHVSLGSPRGPQVALRTSEGAAAGARPAAAGSADDADITAAVDDAALRLVVDDEAHVVPPGGEVVVGRDPGCAVTVDGARDLVSRRHVRFAWSGGGWEVEDLGSTRGTFIDGRRLRTARAARGSFVVRLGDPHAGTAVNVVAPGTHRPRGRWITPAAATAAAVAVVAAIVVLLASGSGDTPNTASQRALARQATVIVELLGDDLERAGLRGSGVLVSADGLVLTNAHIAYAATHGERVGSPSAFPDAEQVAIGFASEDGGEVDRFYVAEPVALHPFHDAAIVQIVADGNNAPDFDLPFAPLPIGAVAGLEAGDLVDQLGYPSVAGTLRASVTTRNFQSFAPCRAAPDDDCLADLDDGWLNLSGQPLGSGASGGPIVRGGELIGINQGAVLQADRAVEQNRAVPIHVIVAELPLD